MRRSRIHKPTWHAALEAVQTGLELLPKRYRFSRQQAEVLEAVSAFCADLRPNLCVPILPRNLDLARKYQVSLRTVTNWRREGCPFEKGQWAVLRWLASRRYAPAGTEQRFKQQLERGRLRALVDAVKTSYAEVRQVKRLYRIHGIEPDGWLRRIRSAPV